jgi:phosphoribosyl-ATP pyrophosphohydrolase
VIAAVADDRAGMIAESADLLFHLSVLWADAGITPDDIDAELARREGVSGIAEKAARKGD